jgi:hypothetical protein
MAKSVARVYKPSGRPAAGVRPGERVVDYKSVKLRLPDAERAWLDAAVGVIGRPIWRVLLDALMAYVGEGEPLSDAKMKAIRATHRARALNGKE